MSNRVEFLYNSISDTQSTIRALDQKASFMLIVLFVPVPAFGELDGAISFLFHESTSDRLVVIAMLIAWILSIFLQFATLRNSKNPHLHIPGAPGNGCFFSGDLFELSFIDALFGCICLSKRSVLQEAALIPNAEEDVVNELTYEKLKLAYVRSIKLTRSSYSNVATSIWLAISFSAYLIYILET